MMKSLNDLEWKEFTLIELFKNFHGKRLTKKYRQSGKTPLLTASENMQGVTDFIDNKEMTSYEDFISIDMFGHAFYHNYECYGDDNIYFFLNNQISKYAKLFLVSCINQNNIKYSYGKQFRQDNANKDKILLPIDEKGNPDWQFMEDYVKNKEQKLKNEYKNSVEARIKNFEKFIDKEKEWQEFYLKDIFNLIQRGKRLKNADHIKGHRAYVSSTFMNNGVDDYIANQEKVRVFRDCLTLANSGSVGSSFYQPFSFVASDHVTALQNKSFNKYIYLFVATMTARLSQKYDFNREINDKRINREIVMLPVCADNQPDYEYMENYMKYIEQQKLLKYLNFIEVTNTNS